MAIIAVAIFIGASSLITGSLQTAKADIQSNANTVGQAVNNNGFSPNQHYMQVCKTMDPAQTCATSSAGNGPFTSGLAHRNPVNR